MYRTTANVMDLLMIYVNQVIDICTKGNEVFRRTMHTLRDTLHALTPIEVCDAYAIAFPAIWRSSLPIDTKRFYTSELNAMHKCIVTQTFEHTYTSFDGETHVHDDFNINGVSTILIHLMTELECIRLALIEFKAQTKNTYINGGRYQDIVEILGSKFETVADLTPTTMYVDILLSYISDAEFRAMLDKVVYHTQQLGNFICDFCDASADDIKSISRVIGLKLTNTSNTNATGTSNAGTSATNAVDIANFNLQTYLAGDTHVGDIKYPSHADIFLIDGAHAGISAYFMHKYVHYLDIVDTSLGDYDPMERMFRYGDGLGYYTPPMHVPLLADSSYPVNGTIEFEDTYYNVNDDEDL